MYELCSCGVIVDARSASPDEINVNEQLSHDKHFAIFERKKHSKNERNHLTECQTCRNLKFRISHQMSVRRHISGDE